MKTPEIDEGIIKWTCLATCIAVLEFLGEESLTHAFDRAMKHDKMQYVALGGLVFTACHLTGVLPRTIDPYYAIQEGVQKWRENAQN